MRAFPPIKDLVTDVSWNFRVKKQIQRFTPRAADAERPRLAAGQHQVRLGPLEQDVSAMSAMIAASTGRNSSERWCRRPIG